MVAGAAQLRAVARECAQRTLRFRPILLPVGCILCTVALREIPSPAVRSVLRVTL